MSYLSRAGTEPAIDCAATAPSNISHVQYKFISCIMNIIYVHKCVRKFFTSFSYLFPGKSKAFESIMNLFRAYLIEIYPNLKEVYLPSSIPPCRVCPSKTICDFLPYLWDLLLTMEKLPRPTVNKMEHLIIQQHSFFKLKALFKQLIGIQTLMNIYK